jgi:DNA invertase Pin-like site-specific DNA recombinase
MRVAIYARVSTSHHDQNPDIQVQELKRFCEGRSWYVAHILIDHGSGGTDKREGLQQLLGLAETKQVECIVVTKLDRLFRSLRQLITALDDFQSKGVAFVAIKDSIDYTTPSGRLFTQILGSLAEFEKSMIRERTIAGLSYAKSVKGKILGRPKQRRNVTVILHLRSQGLSTRKIAELVGCSQATVVRELRDESKRSPS